MGDIDDIDIDVDEWLQRAVELRGSARDFLRSAPPAVRKQREVVLVLVKKDGLALEFAAENLRADREVVLAAVRKGAFALEFASDSLTKDRSFILEAVGQNGYALACAPKYQGDRQIVETALREDGSALEYASDELRGNKEVALLAAASDSALEHVAVHLWQDRNFAAAVLSKNDAAVAFLPASVRNDEKFLLDAVQRNPHLLPRLDGSSFNGHSHATTLTSEFLVRALRRNARCFTVCLQATRGQATQTQAPPAPLTKDILIRALTLDLLKELHSNAPELLDKDFVRSAVEVIPEAFSYADSEFRRDAELVKALSCRRASSLQYADAELRSNQKFLLSLIELNAACLKFCSQDLVLSTDFNLKALQANSGARDHVDSMLWKDRSLVLKALESSEISTTVLEKVAAEHPEVLTDYDFALRIVEMRGSSLAFLTEFSGDKNLVSAALEDDPKALAWASPALREDPRLVLCALRQDGSVLHDAGPSIKDNVAMVLEATKSAPMAFQFASERIRKDQDVVWQALKLSPQVLAFSLLAADGNFVLSASIHFEAAVQYADEVLLTNLGFCLSCVAQNAAVLSFLPNELRASASFVEAAVRANAQALYFAPRHLQSDPSLIRLSSTGSTGGTGSGSNGSTNSTYPSSLRRDAQTLQQHGVPLERLGAIDASSASSVGSVAVAAGNRILSDWERLERLSVKALQEECSMRGLGKECLEWYGVDFVILRLKRLVLLQELPLPELRSAAGADGAAASGAAGAAAPWALRVGASVLVVEDFFSVGNVKLKRGLIGKITMINNDAKIDFREQNTSAGTFASQWVYQKDFIKLKVEEDEEEHSMLLNQLMIDLFAGVYERKGVPVRSLSSFPAASAVLERWESLAQLQDDQMWKKFSEIFGIEPGGLRRDAQEAALRSAALWREMPLQELLKECEKHAVKLPWENQLPGQLRADLQDRLLGSLCKDLYKAEGLDLQVLGLQAATALLREWRNLDKLPGPELSVRYAALQLPPISEKEQRERLKKVAFWKALPFTALREHCWSIGMRSAYFNSTDSSKEKLVREAVWHQFANGRKSPWSDEPQAPPPKPDGPKESSAFGGPNCPFQYLPPLRPLVPPHIRSCLQRLLLPSDASVGDVKKAYRKLALKYHPDKNNKDENMEKIAAQHFMEIRSAYDAVLQHFDEPG